jgi:hypothetical protein
VSTVWSHDDAVRADVEARGWVLPGLVDVHTHPGAERPGDRLDEQLLRGDLGRQVDVGVLAVRSPGLAGEPPSWFGVEPELPYSCHTGPWLARPG